MKKIIYILTTLCFVISLSSCDPKETFYTGPAQLGFQTTTMTIKALPNKTDYTATYGLITTNETDVKCNFSVVKNTNPAGDRFSIATNLANVVIPAGQLLGTLHFTVNNPAYDGGLRDTLVLAIQSADVGNFYNDTLTVYFQQLCPINDVADLEGYYQYYDEDGFDPSLEYRVTHVAGDTLLFDMTLDCAQDIYGAGVTEVYPIKVTIDHSTDVYTTKMVDNQLMYVYPDPGPGRVVARPRNTNGPVPLGEVDLCQEFISITFGRQVPDIGPTIYYNGYVEFPLKKARPL